jgi:protein tyrosine/serine phosphatase
VELLAKLGVKTLVDLRSKYDRTPGVEAEAERVGLQYYWLPLSVWDPPTDAQTDEFVSVVTDQSRSPVFVFCTDGLNRTGEMTAIYRINHDGWSVEQALKEMDDAGFSPYYYSLRNYVWTYARSQKQSISRLKAAR